MYAHVVDLGVSKLELTNYVAGVRCNDAETYDQYDTAGKHSQSLAPSAVGRMDIRDDTNGGESGREREDPEGNGLGDHDCRYTSVMCGALISGLNWHTHSTLPVKMLLLAES